MYHICNWQVLLQTPPDSSSVVPVSQNAVSKNAVSKNAVNKNAVSENAVSENVVVERIASRRNVKKAQNGSTCKASDMDYTAPVQRFVFRLCALKYIFVVLM